MAINLFNWLANIRKILGNLFKVQMMSPQRGEGGPPKFDTSIYPYVVKRVTGGKGGLKLPKWR